MQARSIRWGPSSSSLSAEPQGAAQLTLTFFCSSAKAANIALFQAASRSVQASDCAIRRVAGRLRPTRCHSSLMSVSCTFAILRLRCRARAATAPTTPADRLR